MLSPRLQSEAINRLSKVFAFPISAYDALVDQFIKEMHEGLQEEQLMVNVLSSPIAMIPEHDPLLTREMNSLHSLAHDPHIRL